ARSGVDSRNVEQTRNGCWDGRGGAMQLRLGWIGRYLILAGLMGSLVVGQHDGAVAARPNRPEEAGSRLTLTEEGNRPWADSSTVPEEVPAGGQALFQATVTNIGTQTVSGILTETLPSGTTFAGATLTSYDPSISTWVTNPIAPTLNGNQAVYALGDLAPQ